MPDLINEIMRVAGVSPKHALQTVFNLVDNAAAFGGVFVSDLYDRLSVADNNYRMMLRARMSGADDGANDELVRKLKEELFDVLRSLTRRALLANPTSPLSWSMADAANRQAMTAQQWHEAHLALLSPGNSDEAHREFDDMLRTVFDDIALTAQLSPEQYEGIANIIDDVSCSDVARLTIVSALTINALRYFNALTFDKLVEIATYHDTLRQRALAGIMMLLVCRFDELSVTQHFFKASLPLLMQIDGVKQDIKTMLGWMFIAITAPQLAEELDKSIGSLIRSSIKKSKKEKNDDSDPDATPKWMRRVEDVLTSKIEDMMRLAAEGYDLHYASFRYQRTMPYWRVEYHWFTPFYNEDPAFRSVLADQQNALLLNIMKMQQAPGSHVKSLILQFVNLPQNIVADIGKQIKEQIKEQTGEEEIDKADIMPDDAPAAVSQRVEMLYYIHDLFRFFSLHAAEDGELGKAPRYLVLRGMNNVTVDPFDFERLTQAINTISRHILGEDIGINDTLINIVLALINGNMHERAKKIMELIRVSDSDTDALRQLGYVREKLGQTKEAIECYEKAETIEHDDPWTNRRLVHCYSKIDDDNMAVSIFERLSDMFLNVDDLMEPAATSYFRLNNFGQCLSCCRAYEQSVPAEQKPLPWCFHLEALSLCVLGRYDEATPCVENLIAEQEQPDTFIIAGHHALCLGDTMRAVAFYHKAFKMLDDEGKQRKALRSSTYDKRVDVRALTGFNSLFSVLAVYFPAVPKDDTQQQYLIDAAMYGTL